MEDEAGKSLGEYWAVLSRRRALILSAALAILVIAAGLALALPPVFRSSATILVQEQEIPPDLVRSTVTSFADERIQVISQQVMTRAVLLDLVDRHDLYAKFRARESNDQILERMRKDIKLSTVNANFAERGSGRQMNATIAFRISYDAPKPAQAQKVVEELVALYLSENVKARQRSVAETTAFLAEEAERVARQIQETEAKLASFKRQYAGRLPETSAINQQLADRTEGELQRIEREVSMLEDRRSYIETQLSLVKPYQTAPATAPANDAMSPEERLRTLRAQYAAASAAYSPEHPDVRRLKREIAALGGSAAAGAGATDQLAQMESDLARLKERYADDHPDVQRLSRSIAALKSGEDRKAAGSSRAPVEVGRAPDNPAYITLQSQLETTKRELTKLAAVRGDLRAKQRDYDTRLLQIPEIEREYRDLTRDYDSAQSRYRDLKAKQMQAEVAETLEKDRKGERFTLSEPANLPERPEAPNRPQILLVGLIASLGGGIGLGWLRDVLDPSIKGPLELARIARMPILTAIPYIETARERGRQRSRQRRFAWVAVALLAIAAVFVHYSVKPLPDIWAAAMRFVPF